MKMERLPRQAYSYLPASTRRRLYPTLRELYCEAKKLIEAARGLAPMPCVLATGPAKGEPGTAFQSLISGSHQDIRSLSGYVFDSRPQHDQRAPTSLWHLNAFFEEALEQHDLVMLSIPHLFRSLVKKKCMILPQGVEVVIPVETGLSRIKADTQPLNSYRRKIEHERLRYEVHTASSMLERFYYRFYRPYSQVRFNDLAIILPFTHFARFSSQAEVLMVTQGGQQVAAMLGIHHEDRYRFAAVGYLNGDSHYLSIGAGHALHAFALERAAACRHTLLDMGPIRPFLENSVFKYRRPWGAQLRTNPWASRVLVLGIGRLTPAIARWLRRSPMIIEPRRGCLWGLTAPDPEGPDARIDEISRRYEGISLRGFLPVSAAPSRKE
jgi:hypothetical protein